MTRTEEAISQVGVWDKHISGSWTARMQLEAKGRLTTEEQDPPHTAVREAMGGSASS